MGNPKRWVFRVSAILFITLFALLAFAALMIGAGIKRSSQIAREHYTGDRITALIAMAGCESCNLSDRNHAVWALGMLADQRAVPVLGKYYNGKPCNHLQNLCQYELRKALRLVRSGHNPSAFLWRWMLPIPFPVNHSLILFLLIQALLVMVILLWARW
jgi:hypothetical protein